MQCGCLHRGALPGLEGADGALPLGVGAVGEVEHLPQAVAEALLNDELAPFPVDDDGTRDDVLFREVAAAV